MNWRLVQRTGAVLAIGVNVWLGLWGDYSWFNWLIAGVLVVIQIGTERAHRMIDGAQEMLLRTMLEVPPWTKAAYDELAGKFSSEELNQIQDWIAVHGPVDGLDTPPQVRDFIHTVERAVEREQHPEA